MQQVLLIAIGGAFGALSRFALSTGVAALLGRDFPFGTLLVNVLGSLLIGGCYVLFTERAGDHEALRSLLVIGFLGALTTFSTFSIETLQLIESGALARAAISVIANVTLCLGACWIGLVTFRQMLNG